MRRLSATALLALVLVLVLSTVVSAGGPAEKATGSFGYYEEGYYFNFNAHEAMGNRPAKGEAWNYTPSGDWYHAMVQCVEVVGDDAWFVAELVESSQPSWGPYIWIKVYDGGTPGTNGDMIWGQFIDEATAMAACGDPMILMGTPANGPWNLYSGNLVVHTQ